MNFNKKLAVAVSGAVLLMAGQFALADSTTDIVDALVGKGVLTEEEGKLITKGHESKKEKTLEGKFKDGYVIESSDGKNSMKIGGRLHADYRSFNNNIADNSTNAGTSKQADTWDIRRARIELSGTYRQYFDYLLSIDAAGATNGQTVTSSVSCSAVTLTGDAATITPSCTSNKGSKDVSILDQAYLNFKFFPKAQIRVGQFKSPMNLEKLTSSNNMDFQERSVVNQLAPNEDRGIMVHGVPVAGTSYAFGIMSGEGAKNRIDMNARVDQVEYVGRLTANIAQFIDNKDAILHVGGAYSYTNFDKLSTADTQGEGVNGWLSGTSAFRTEARGAEYLKLPTVTAGVSGVSNEIQRSRYGLEGVGAFGPVKLQAEWIRNNFKYDQSTSISQDLDVNAYYVEALWLMSGEKYADFYKDGNFGAIKPKNEFDIDKNLAGGAWEFGVRYSKLEANDFKNAGLVTVNTSTATNTTEADTWVAGLKFVPNNNTRILLNYVNTKFDTPIVINNALRDREQAITTRLQFMF